MSYNSNKRDDKEKQLNELKMGDVEIVGLWISRIKSL